MDRIPNQFSDAVDEETRQRREWLERHRDGFPRARKVQEALDRARTSWIAEFGRLDEIAVDVYHGKRGGFLKKFADAWLHAEACNKRLIKPMWAALIRKYGLEEDPKGTGVPEARAPIRAGSTKSPSVLWERK